MTLLVAAQEGYEALKDIINAAGGGAPYEVDELESDFLPLLGLIRRTIIENGGVLENEIP